MVLLCMNLKTKFMVKILHLSDTHNLHRQIRGLPEADIVVHSGDFTFAGAEGEAMDFLQWFCDLPYKHKVLIAGNHDDCLFGADVEGLPENCHYLYGNGVEIEGFHFYGVPMFMEDDISGHYQEMLASIPLDTDVLITHQPCYGILDESDWLHYGSKFLLSRVQQVKPMLHLFGHIHMANGLREQNGIVFSNAAVVGDDYRLQHSYRLITI